MKHFGNETKIHSSSKPFPEKKYSQLISSTAGKDLMKRFFCDLASVFQPGGFQPVHMLVIIQLID